MSWFTALANPILERELRARFRGKRSFLLLTLFVLLEIGIFVLLFASIAVQDSVYPSSAGAQSLGRRVFDRFAAVLLGLVVLFTPASAASVIAAEREKRTLESLELTLLTPLEIVVGKLAVALMYMGVLGVTALPVVSLVFVLGGVSPQHVVALYGVLAVIALGLGSIGVWVSAMSKSTVGATVTSYALAMVLSPFWGMLLDRPLSHGGASWARLLHADVPWFRWHLRPLTLAAVPVLLLAHVLVQHAAARMANPDQHPPAGERVSMWMAFVGLLALCAGFGDAAHQSVADQGLPVFLLVEGLMLMVVLVASSMAHEPCPERALGAARALACVVDPRSLSRARVLGEPWFVLLLCLSGAAVHLAAVWHLPRWHAHVLLEWGAFHALMIGLAVPVSLVFTAAVAVWERWMPDLPRGFRLAFAGVFICSLFGAEFLHWSLLRKEQDAEALPLPAVVLVHLSPCKALSTLDTSLSTRERTRRNFPGHEWEDLAPFTGQHRPGWVGSLCLYAGMGALAAMALALAHRRRAPGAQ